MNDDIFNKYYKRVARRAWTTSIVIGMFIGFCAMLVAAVIIFVLRAYSLFYIPIIALVAVACVSACLFYFLKYRPDIKEVANAVDALGMEERFVTMVELEGNNSYIAQRQRSDTYLSSQSVPSSAIKITVSTLLLCLVIVFGALGLGATTYVALADAGIAPGMDEVVDAVTSDTKYTYYTVEYEEYSGSTYMGAVVGDGYINGQIVQTVKEGENCTTVYAQAMDDSVFYCWSDGNTNPMRTDTKILEDKKIYAVFLLLEEGDGAGDGSADGEEIDGDGDSSGMGEEGFDSDDDGMNSDNVSDEYNDQTGTSSGAGGGVNMNNNVYDNNTDYETEIDSAVDKAGDSLNNGNYTDTDKEVSGGYFDKIYNP